MGAVFLPGREELFRDGIDCLVPADGLEPALAPFSHPAQRGEDTVLPVEVLAVAQTLGAELAFILRVVGGAFHLDDLSVLDIDIQSAVHTRSTDVTDAVADLNAAFGTGDLALAVIDLSHDIVPPSSQ